jgi:small subunit ribosomal protein S1
MEDFRNRQFAKAVVLDFNEKKERISLGMKQLTKHPWEDVAAKLPRGHQG